MIFKKKYIIFIIKIDNVELSNNHLLTFLIYKPKVKIFRIILTNTFIITLNFISLFY